MRILSIIILLIIVIFVNYNIESPLWDLFYYMQNYIIVSTFIYLGFLLRKDVITRSVLIALGFYYAFELGMDILNVIDSELRDNLYTTKLINYIISIGCGLSLMILPILKKWVK